MGGAGEGSAPRAIDAVRRSFTRQLRKLVVPEWGLDLFFGPLTVAEMEAVEKRQPRTPYERNLFLLVSSARDAEGRPVFDFTDIHHLRSEADLNVITRIVAFMWSGIPDPKEADKEVEGNPDSASG